MVPRRQEQWGESTAHRRQMNAWQSPHTGGHRPTAQVGHFSRQISQASSDRKACTSFSPSRRRATYLPLMPFMHSTAHLGSLPILMSFWVGVVAHIVGDDTVRLAPKLSALVANIMVNLLPSFVSIFTRGQALYIALQEKLRGSR
jgi:hypothetical protein